LLAVVLAVEALIQVAHLVDQVAQDTLGLLLEIHMVEEVVLDATEHLVIVLWQQHLVVVVLVVEVLMPLVVLVPMVWEAVVVVEDSALHHKLH